MNHLSNKRSISSSYSIRQYSKKKKNPDLWIRFLKIYKKHRVSFIWVKGHNNNKENERCDFLAVQAAESKILKIDSWYENTISNNNNSLF